MEKLSLSVKSSKNQTNYNKSNYSSKESYNNLHIKDSKFHTYDVLPYLVIVDADFLADTFGLHCSPDPRPTEKLFVGDVEKTDAQLVLRAGLGVRLKRENLK